MLLLLRVRLEHAPTALAPFECAGFCLVGLRTAVPTGDALIALRWHAEANNTDVIAQLCEAARAQLPAGVALSITASQEDALEQMRAHFGPREVVQWAADPADPSRHAEPPLGDALQHAGAPWLEEVLRAAPGSSGAGAAFVRRLRRDGYAPLLLTASQAALWREVEGSAATWFAQSTEAKLEQAGAYAHIDRKFTGYRDGKYREQLEVRATPGAVHPAPVDADGRLRFSAALSLLVRTLDGVARGLLPHVAAELGCEPRFLAGLCDAAPSAPSDNGSSEDRGEDRGEDGGEDGGEDRGEVSGACGCRGVPLIEASELDAAVTSEAERIRGAARASASFIDADADADAAEAPRLAHSLLRLCRYDSRREGAYGTDVLCEEHNDVGLLTLDVCASAAGLHALRRSDGLWVPVEETALRADGGVALVVMVGDTLARLSAGHFAPCKHRVVAPRSGERVGLPFLFRGRSDAVLDTRPALAAAAAAGRVAHLAELETVTIRDLPSFDSARSILKGWFRSVRKPKPIESAM
mmetsp:Transcript_12640/g.41947  ORF Transcript_12640/g.41947 Transcript_12640/m.41947 type:complete len:526 (-) Transcript_12640:228-1805(-)